MARPRAHSFCDRSFIGMGIGFRFSENMYGSYERLTEPGLERRFCFHFDVVSHDVWKTMRDGRAEATGYVEAEGLARHAALRGFIVIKPLVARLIRYEFEFTAEDESSYHYAGQKTIRHLHPATTWTTLPGILYHEDSTEFATSITRFDPNELFSFLRSFRTTLHGQ